jgi:chemotaxis family two-component system response regulator Rcp1
VHRAPPDVLLVEDEASDIDLIREALGEVGAEVRLHIVEDGERALAYLRHQPPYEQAIRPDLILLDLNLPRVDGRDVLRALKQSPATRTIPVIVLSTSEAESDIEGAYRAGANCYVTKPFSFEGWVSAVDGIRDFWLHTVQLPSRRRT